MGWRGALPFFIVGMLLVLPAPAAAFNCGYQVKTDGRSIPQGPNGSLSSSIYLLPEETLEDVDIWVDITHPGTGEIDISVSHAGRVVSLSTRNGSGANYRDTVFDDEAAGSITSGSAPFSGSFKPENPLSAFDGLPAGGVWTLTVTDRLGVIDGGGGGSPPPQRLESWGLDRSSSSCSTTRSPCDESGNNPNTSIGNPGASLLGQNIVGTGTVTDVDVHIRRITAANAGDVELKLSHAGVFPGPDLTSDNGGTGDNYVGTIFDDSAAVAVEAFAAPFTGRLRPEEPLGVYLNFPVAGNWTLRVEDDNGPGPTVPADVVVNTWGITVKSDGCVDPDGDVIYSTIDNCPGNGNVGQENLDKDAQGNACDADDDADGRPDADDACPLGTTGAGDDLDGDGCKAPEDPDDDGDGSLDPGDACPAGATGAGDDLDGDGCKSGEDGDDDGDGTLDGTDRCPTGTVGAKPDRDGDGCGDAEDTDGDDDGILEATDACPALTGPAPVGCPVFPRRVTLGYSSRKRTFSGRLTAQGPGPCASKQRLTLRKVRRGPDAKVGKSLLTNSKGRFSLRRRVSPGRYYAEVTAATLPGVALCAATKSKSIRP